ncbi:ABC transporter permease [Actinomadura nitritigenes]|uniref:ABC transporter permease n=1 Tax=Actinomadura nitritigenes TaxID=134602 RepID=UPI003D9308B4
MNFIGQARGATGRFPWLLSFVAVVVTWIAIVLVSGRGLGGTLFSAVEFAPFLVLVGLGQMLVISMGYGNIDLSIPYVMTLASFVSVSVMDGGHGSLVLGLAAALGCGLAVGAVNAVCILALSVPPIVATLATGLIASAAAAVRAGDFGSAVDPRMHDFVTSAVGRVSVLAILCAAGAGIVAFVLHRTGYGRSLLAYGQSPRAADLAGVRITRTRAITYIISALLAALSGTLLAAYVSPSLGIGDPYMLNSVAVVVLGGTLIVGGRSNAPGVWGGTLFLTLLVTLLNVLHISAAVQDIVKGLLIIAVLSVVGGASRRET